MPFNVWNIPEQRWMSLHSFARRRRAAEYLEDVVMAAPNAGRAAYEIRRVHPVLEQHGTKLMTLKPGMLWNIAMEDLQLREYNRHHGPGQYKVYAFHRRHVAGAETANDVIRAALATPHHGIESGKKDTRLLYSDLKLLEAALQ